MSKENRGKFKKTAIYLNSSYQLEYQTDAKNARIYIYSTVGVEKSEAKARTMATSYKTGATMGFKFGDLQEEPIKLTNKIGQNESLSLLKYKGKPAGNLFATAIDKKAVLVLFTGVYFDNEQDFRQFIDGYIERVTNFQIDKS